jgi:c-di-GMP-binding flagellar brake protein YcgR
MMNLSEGAIFMQDNNSSERRKYKRLPIELQLEVDEVFKQDHIVIKNLSASVLVFDISKTGIGFVSEACLPLGYYFKGRINLGDGDFFYVVIQIVRAHISDQGKMIYGAEFIGLAPFLADKVDKYEKKLK